MLQVQLLPVELQGEHNRCMVFPVAVSVTSAHGTLSFTALKTYQTTSERMLPP